MRAGFSLTSMGGPSRMSTCSWSMPVVTWRRKRKVETLSALAFSGCLSRYSEIFCSINESHWCRSVKFGSRPFMATPRSLNMSSAVGPCGVRCSTPGRPTMRPQPATVSPTMTATATLDVSTRHLSMAASIADRPLNPRRSRSNQRALEDDAAVDGAGGLRQQPGGDHRDLRAVGQLAQQVDQPPHGPDQIALVAPERTVHDAGPVVVAGGPAMDGRHEPRLDADRHAQVPPPLGLEDRVGDAHQGFDLA